MSLMGNKYLCVQKLGEISGLLIAATPAFVRIMKEWFAWMISTRLWNYSQIYVPT